MEANPMMIDAPIGDGPESFANSGLDALLAAAAQDCPDAMLLLDDAGASSAADLDRRARALAALFRAAGLVGGERVLITAGAQTNAVVAIIGCLHAGLEPALVPCGLGPVELAAHARVAEAVALVGPSRYGTLDLGEVFFSAAALAERVRLIGSQGPDAVDGAIDISLAALDGGEARAGVSPVTRDAAPHEPPVLLTFQGAPHAPAIIAHRQAALLADALSLVEQARINPSKRIVSTLPPATRGGLVAGPFAAFVGASSLVLHGPFEARRFLAACDEEPGYHLVAPAAMGPSYADHALSGELTSLILVSRFPTHAAFVLPPAIACERPIVDLYAIGEDTLLAQRRVDGEARPPARVTDKSIAGGLGARLNRAWQHVGRPAVERT